MYFDFSDEERRFRAEVIEFLKKEIPADYEASGPAGEVETEEEWRFARSMTKKLGEKGWLSLSWPKAYGGEGNIIKHLMVNEEFYYREAPGVDPVGVNMVAPALIEQGSEEQKKQYLPLIARGETVFCQGFSEPGAGSDLANVTTRAVQKDGDFVINGQKIWTSFAQFADYIIVLTRTNPDVPRNKGLTMFFADMKTHGITVRPLHNMANMHNFNEVFFDDVRVPARNIVGKQNQGWAVAMSVLGFERSGIHRISAARKHLDRILEYARKSGKSKDPLVRQRLAALIIEGQVAQLMAYRVAWMQSQKMPVVHEPSISRVFGCEFQQRVAREGIKLFGSYGQLVKGSKWAYLDGKIAAEYLTAPGSTIGAGTSEMQRNAIALRGLGLPRE